MIKTHCQAWQPGNRDGRKRAMFADSIIACILPFCASIEGARRQDEII